MSTTLEQLDYGFDRASRRTWRRRALTINEDDAYGYDGLSQVVNAARGTLNQNATAVGAVPVQKESWDYDPTGNWRGYRVESNGAVSLAQPRVHDKGNRLTEISESATVLDRVGRMRQTPPNAGGSWSQPLELKWDAWSRLVGVKQNGSTIGTYAYDGLTRRTTRTTGGITWHSYYSDAWRPLEERRDSQSTAALHYYWGARHRDDLVRRDRATTSGGSLNETRYVLMDYFSPAAITDGSGNVTERYSFSAFGVRRLLTPSWAARTTSECAFTFAFQGQFLDTESGLLNYGYRSYSPLLGRWLCKDPIGEEGGLNTYSLSENRPSDAVDLLGLVGMFPPGPKCSPCKDGKEMEKDDLGNNCCPEDIQTSPKGVKQCKKPRDDEGKEKKPGDEGWIPPQWLIDFGAGFGDTWTFGTTAGVRNLAGIDNVDVGSGAYLGGAGTALGTQALAGGAIAGLRAGGNTLRGALGSELRMKGGELVFTPKGKSSPDFRYNPKGHSGGVLARRLPHYHRRPGIGKHRPYEGGF